MAQEVETAGCSSAFVSWTGSTYEHYKLLTTILVLYDQKCL